MKNSVPKSNCKAHARTKHDGKQQRAAKLNNSCSRDDLLYEYNNAVVLQRACRLHQQAALAEGNAALENKREHGDTGHNAKTAYLD